MKINFKRICFRLLACFLHMYGLGRPKNEERQSKTARKIAQVKERGGGGGQGQGQGFFLALVSFLARQKPKVPFLGLSLLRNQTETLATHDGDRLKPKAKRLRQIVPLICSVSLFTRYGNRCTSPMRICLILLGQRYKLNFY